jgi:hypothetical protein
MHLQAAEQVSRILCNNEMTSDGLSINEKCTLVLTEIMVIRLLKDPKLTKGMAII